MALNIYRHIAELMTRPDISKNVEHALATRIVMNRLSFKVSFQVFSKTSAVLCITPEDVGDLAPIFVWNMTDGSFIGLEQSEGVLSALKDEIHRMVHQCYQHVAKDAMLLSHCIEYPKDMQAPWSIRNIDLRMAVVALTPNHGISTHMANMLELGRYHREGRKKCKMLNKKNHPKMSATSDRCVSVEDALKELKG